MANCIRKPIRHAFATGETSITFETPQNDRECLRTATNVWRSFAIIANSWRTAFVSPFAIYSPQCETSIRRIQLLSSEGINKNIITFVRSVLLYFSTVRKPFIHAKYCFRLTDQLAKCSALLTCRSYYMSTRLESLIS